MEYQKLDHWETRTELSLLRPVKPVVKEIWYRGVWNKKIFQNCAAVVGSRRMTEYGKRVMEKLIPRLVFEKKTIVSGFMYGVDQYAHNLAIENGGKTIAVLGWGIGNGLQAADDRLQKKIVDSGGLMLSEWENQIPALWTFPLRNRIVAGLAYDIYVIEGGIKSGSLITAEWGRKLNKTVWAVPGPITSKVSEGTNWLIAEGKAKMWTGGEKQVSGHGLRVNKLNPITRILGNEALTVDEVARKLGKPVAEVGAELTILLLQGEVKEREGKYYIE